MNSYGTLEAGTSIEAGQDQQKTQQQRASQADGPIFLENPDGTITEAVPWNYKAAKGKDRNSDHRRRQQALTGEDSDVSSTSENAATTMYQDVEYLYCQHQWVLMLLLAVQFVATMIYNFVYVYRMRDGSSPREFMEMYAWNNRIFAEHMLWFVFLAQAGFTVSYYAVAATALWTRQPKRYRMLANFGVAGILGLVLLAYVDKFNLIIFFLHLLTYIYAKFLQGLTASLLLLPPPGAAAA